MTSLSDLPNLSFIPLDDGRLQVFSDGKLVETVPAEEAASVLNDLVQQRFLKTRKLRPGQKPS